MLENVYRLPYWSPKRPWGEWQAERDARLHRFVNEQLYPYSPFYRRLFDDNKIDPRSIRRLDDLRRIPFTTKKDIAPTADSPTRHLDLVLQPDLEKIRRFAPKSKLLELIMTRVLRGEHAAREAVRQEYGPVHVIFTTGRTSLPTQFVYSPVDFDRLHVVGKRLADVVGIGEEVRSLNVFPFAPHLAFWQTFAVGQGTPTLAVHTGGGKVMGTAGNILAMARMQPDVIIGIPGFVYHMLRQAAEEGVKLTKLKKIALGGERVPLPLRARLSQICASMGAPNVKVQSVFGFTESRICWAECEPPDHETSYGFHTYPDMDVFECVNPDTGEPVGPGERGELVYSTLTGRGSCVLRYKGGDIAETGIVNDPCPGCGRIVPRVSTWLSRRSDVGEFQLTKIRGTLVDLNNFLPSMAEMVEVVEWQLTVRKKNDDPNDLD
ncbi:MAG TPA: AMP-binding protein, partial [Candidatus Eremiobacteraceae bacterium]|nr:AMP-binding protein [Candidatus Eremiobacteraceae bacterium]